MSSYFKGSAHKFKINKREKHYTQVPSPFYAGRVEILERYKFYPLEWAPRKQLALKNQLY